MHGTYISKVCIITICIVGENIEEAERLFRQAISLDPNTSIYYSGLSQALFVKIVGRYAVNLDQVRQEGVATARKAVELDKDDPVAHANLGRCLTGASYVTGEFEESISAAEKAVELNPSLTYAHYSLGRILENAGQSERAISHLKTAIRLSPRDQFIGQTMHGLAGAYFDLAEYDAALEWLTKAERANPNLPWQGRNFIRVAALVLTGRLDEARNVKDSIITKHPEATISTYCKEYSGISRTAIVTDAVRQVEFPE
jgi:tetratricopeptide (TPR) repeat protein